MKKSYVFPVLSAALALLVLVGTAQASIVTYTLAVDEDGPGTFNLYAATELTNGGISGYGVDLVGVTSLVHESPLGSFSAISGGPIGFDLGRSVDNVPFVLGSQNIVHSSWPAGAIYGLGQTASDFASEGLGPVFGTIVGDNWDAPLLLASGTYAGSISFNETGPNVGANVFANAGDLGVVGADVAFVVIPAIPEPGTLMLAGLGLIGVVVMRRRSL